METKQYFPLTSRSVVDADVRSERNKGRTIWLAVLAISGLGGIGVGIAGLLLSFLTAEGVIPASSSVRLIVPILIVGSLTLFMCSAHALDHLYQTRK